MVPGDLIQLRRVLSRPKKFGVLLEDPIFPNVGDYPKRYRVFTTNGVEEWIDEFKTIIEVVQ